MKQNTKQMEHIFKELTGMKGNSTTTYTIKTDYSYLKVQACNVQEALKKATQIQPYSSKYEAIV